jgi:hypothetical protein
MATTKTVRWQQIQGSKVFRLNQTNGVWSYFLTPNDDNTYTVVAERSDTGTHTILATCDSYAHGSLKTVQNHIKTTK